MKTEMWTMGKNGGLVKVDMNKNTDLPIGQVVRWGGNMGWLPESFVLVGKIDSDYGVKYQAIALNDYRKRMIDAHSIKSKDDPDIWHSQHFFIMDEVYDQIQLNDLRVKSDLKQQSDQEIQEQKDKERKALIEKGKVLFNHYIPKEAKALIVAIEDENQSDIMTDYFAHGQAQKVVLGWSKHTRNLFSEMKNYADKIEETAHLKPGKKFIPRVVIKENFEAGGNYYHAGCYSHWHSEYDDVEFSTKEEAENYIMDHPLEGVWFDGKLQHFKWEIKEESFEHRENWSMGDGYYLKDGYSHSSAWRIEKEYLNTDNVSESVYISLAKRCVL